MKRLELIIVLVVISVLGVITWKQFDLANKKSRDVERKSNLHEVSKVIKLYYADYGKLPDEVWLNSLWGQVWKDGDYVYMEKLPEEIYYSQQYCYKTYDDGVTFGLLTELEYSRDVDCWGNSFECGGKKYCFEDKMSAEISD